MGKRKKKSRAENGKEGLQSVPTTAVQLGNVVESPPQNWLDVRLLQSQSAGSIRDSLKEPIVYLTEQDAYKIDVINGDSVLLLTREGGDEMVVASAVCSARIATDGTTPRKLSSPGQSGGRQSVRLSQGNCRVSPSSLCLFLCSSDNDETVAFDSSPKKEPVSTPASSSRTSPTTPSTPNTPFSFAKGGGGDQLISPSSSIKSPRTPSRSLSQRIWIVPLQCPLGKSLVQLLSCDAAQVSLRLSSDVNDVVWSKSRRVIRQLLLANHKGRWLHEGDDTGISFQGKSLTLNITHIEAKPLNTDSMDDLSNQVADMKLDSVDGDERIIEAVRRGLQQDDCKKRVRLFKVTSATEIVLMLNNDGESSASDSPQEASPPRRVVAGLDATLEQVKSILTPPLLRSDLFKSHSLRPPRGVLLHGPSGVGKSMLARQIEQDLRNDVHVKTVNCTTFQSQTAIVGEAERHLSRLFETIQSGHDKPGTLLILDDVHLICPKRAGRNQGADRLSATLLALLDGIGTSIDNQNRGNLVILGITSNPLLLDPALRRPGRLDSEIEVPIPDEVSRAEILEFQLKRLGTSVSMEELQQSDYATLSRLAKGFNGADVMLAIKEALRRAIGEADDPNAATVTRAHLEASIRSTKPSTISSITVEIPQVHWISIGGMEPVKQKLREAIELPITHAHLFEALNIPPPRGVLLYGPPGCSKTLMARALATEGQMNFLAVKGPELLSKWLGESERALASLFRRARMASPCIIFFDEIDAIASKRGGGEGGAGGERLLSQLLTELDGIGSPGGTTTMVGSGKDERVIVVGATNRPDLLDSALTRPGRIDRMIYVGLPDSESRARIFEIGLKGKACSDDVDFCVLSREETSGGFSGAEIIAICREAALLAIEEDDERMEASSSPQIAMRHLTRAISEMKRQVTPEMLDFYASFNTKGNN